MRKGDRETDEQGFESSADRFIREDGVWFLRTREGKKGPYLSEFDAQQVLATYVETMEYLDARRVPTRFDTTNATIIRLVQNTETGGKEGS